MTVRPAVDADLAAITAILEANDEPVSWPGVPRAPYVDHLLTRPGLRLVVGEVDGMVAGVAGSIEVGSPDRRFLTDLYVDPKLQSQGLGRAMLREVMSGATDRMTFSSRDPRALGSYIRSGMRPWWPLLYLELDAGGLGPQEADVEVHPSDVAATAELSKAWSGLDRTADFEFYARLPEAEGFTLLLDGAPAAIGWARKELHAPGRWLDHASFAPDSDRVRAAFGVLRVAARDERLGAAVPGPHPAVGPLLDHGLRIDGNDTFCATDRDLVDPTSLFPSPGAL
jgi:ribosomal protein S18 acetylase RimI-like enzyme